MAVIQTIRTKYAKLTSGIIVVALLGFILMDFGKSNGSHSTTIGEINGTKVDINQYEAAIKDREDQIKQRNQGLDLSDEQQAQIRDQVWNQIVNQQLLADLNDQLGVTVGEAEINDLLTGPNPDPMVKQQFTDPKTGVFNPQEVSATIQKIKNDPNMKGQWEAFKADLVKRRYAEKFNSMVNGGIYVPKFVVNDLMKGQHNIAGISYVKLPYTLVPDAQAKVTDAELTKYMQAHKKMFEVEKPSRSIEYVSFKIIPSDRDTARVLNDLATIKEKFATTEDPKSFVNLHSQKPIPPAYYTKEQLKTLPNAETLMDAPVNSIIGPFYEGDGFMLAKVLDKTTFPDSVKCRHILVVTKQGTKTILSDSAAKSRIDSAIAMVKAGVPFDSVALRYSDDPGSKNNGGIYDFSLAQKTGLTKEFGDFVFGGKTGESKLVKVSSDNYSGYHYIQILSQSQPVAATKIAFISKELIADKNTFSEIYSNATSFVTKVSSGADFNKTAEAQNLTTAESDDIDANSYLINGLGSAKEVVKWAYEAKIGDISPVEGVGDNQYVVAKLINIQPAGLVQITDKNRPMLSAYVMKEKKAKIIMDKYKGTSLESIAAAARQTVGQADSIRFLQSFIPGIGNEPKVIGYAFNNDFKENALSPAITGNEGVYYMTVTQRAALPADSTQNAEMLRKQWTANINRNAYQLIVNNLRKSGDIEDKRAKLY